MSFYPLFTIFEGDFGKGMGGEGGGMEGHHDGRQYDF